jgi:two-component system phosphate regulon sensor histidine kinase PhoR
MISSVNELSAARHSKQRLRRVMGCFLVALLVPLVILFFWTFQQLKTRGFLSLRMESEALLARIDERIIQLIEPEDRRPFDEYSFFSVSQNAAFSQKGVRYSPLAEIPSKSAVPGVIGYFQVNPDRTVQTPLLPGIGGDVASGDLADASVPPFIQKDELQRRQKLQNEIIEIVETETKRQGGLARAVEKDSVAKPADTEQQYVASPEEGFNALEDNKSLSGLDLDEGFALKNAPGKEASIGEYGSEKKVKADQRVARKEQVSVAQQQLNNKVSQSSGNPYFRGRSTEIFGIDIGSLTPSETPYHSSDTQPAPSVSQDTVNLGGISNQILTFEGEIDLLRVKSIAQGRLLFYRRVWHDKAQFTQGFVVDRTKFFSAVIDQPFSESPLKGSAILRLAQGDSIVRELGPLSTPPPREQLVYKHKLPPPLNAFQIVVSTAQLPLGVGATLVFTLSGLILVAMIVGVFLIYRLTAAQIDLSEKKSDFVSAVSHELKTPLTSIRMYAEMLKFGWVADKEKEESYFEFICSESERLSRLIGNVLQLAGLSQDDSPLQLRPASADEVLNLVSESVRSQVEQAGFQLSVSAEHGEGFNLAGIENDALIRIFINLVDNALKFSKESSRKEVQIGYRVEGYAGAKEVVFFVRDFGPGVLPAQQKKIFQLFYRSESELTRTTPGTGIGLALVKELSRRMNARVDVANCDPGAEFRVIFKQQIE